MRAVIQRVKSARVHVDGKAWSQIDRGLVVLLGIHVTHDITDESENGKPWAFSVKEANLEILSVSQFTLFAQVKKGKKLDFHKAKGAKEAAEIYRKFIEALGADYSPEKIKDGKFQEMMDVELVNDGPVTVIVDSRESA